MNQSESEYLFDDYDEEEDQQIDFQQDQFRPVQSMFEAQMSQIQEASNLPDFDVSKISAFVDSFLQSAADNNTLINLFEKPPEDVKEIENPIEEFTFREYQYEMFEKGKGKNSIIYLETGMGKTLIIIMLMWHQLLLIPSKKVFFLANTIQLVEQQAQQIKQKLPRVAELLGDYEDIIYAKRLITQIKTIHGSKYPDNWNAQMWKLLFETNKVFVMTSQLFLNLLRQGIINLEYLSFLALDECHAAQSDHQYNLIMKEFYFPLKQELSNQGREKDLPQIVGATASPIINSKSISQEAILMDLLKLSANLDSTYLYTDEEIIKQHLKSASIEYLTHLMLFNNIDIQKVIEQNSSAKEILNDQSGILEVLKNNKYIPEFFQLQCILEKKKQQYLKNTQIRIIIKQIEHQIFVNGFHMYLELGPIVLVLMFEYVLSKMADYRTLNSQQMEDQPFADILLTLEEIHRSATKKYINIIESSTPKLQKFLLNLKQIYEQDPNNMVLVFVKQRITACYLNEIVNLYFTSLKIDSKSKFIIGHNACVNKKQTPDQTINILDDTQDTQILIKGLVKELKQDHSKFVVEQQNIQTRDLLQFKYSINFSEQKEILQQFRKGHIKVLISTSVAEEGIDIPLCNYVIGFNLIQSSKAFVQMKGRARKENSKFQILIPEQPEHQVKNTSHQIVQNLTKVCIQELIRPDRIEKIQQVKTNLQKRELETSYYECVNIMETRACINTNWSVSLIHSFCQSIILEGNTRGSPKYAIYEINLETKQLEKGYLAFLLLPLQLKDFLFYGNKQKTLKDAKASAALKAVSILYDNGYLDNHLKPIFTNELGVHIGADEDDSNIEMSADQIKILQRHSKKLIKNQCFIGVKLNTSMRFYQQLNKKYLTTNSKSDSYYMYECNWKNQKFKIIFSDVFLKLLNKSSGYLKQLDIQLCQLESITQTDYESYYNKYIEQVKEQENLIKQIDDIYQQLNVETQYQFKDILEQNIAFIITVSSQLKIQDCLKFVIFSIKLTLMHENLNKRKQIVEKRLDQGLLVGKTKPNIILGKIAQYITQLNIFKLGHYNSPNQQNYNIQNYQQQQKLEQRIQISQYLDQILINCLNLDNPNQSLLVGQSYYKLAISLQLFANFYNKDAKLMRIKQKLYFSSTFIRNQLLDLRIFEYFHKDKINYPLLSLFTGIKKYVDAINYNFDDKLMKQNNIKDSSFRVANFIHVPNYEFSQFVHQSAFQIVYKDNQLKSIFEWLELIGITSELKSVLSSTEQLSLIIPVAIKEDQEILKLKQSYRKLEQIIQYKFTSFELLFRSMTDVSFKNSVNNKQLPRYSQKFSWKDDIAGQLSEKQIKDYINEMNQLNQNDNENYDNMVLSYLGKYIWGFIISKIVELQQLNHLQQLVVKKILCGVPFLALIVVKFGIFQFLNNAAQKLIDMVVGAIQNMNSQSIIFQISQLDVTQNTQILANCYYALIAGIFIDSHCSFEIIQNVSYQLLEQIGFEQLFQVEFINRQVRYRFLNWYQTQFGNPYSFDLIRIPHQDYQKIHNGLYLFMPYDSQKSEIINLLGEDFYDISQLHIYEKSKLKAWQRLDKFIKNIE